MDARTLEEAIMQTVLKKPQKRKIYGQREDLLNATAHESTLSTSFVLCSFIVFFVCSYTLVRYNTVCPQPY
ncbi:hypothetical protein NEMIN01_1810 [Nematocida minor]|uniref:uncharacterized protein n=1 Tax=Nematocida minor TaxID=1912983 RepID=UPI00221FC044|nr:uncharacterized protein NEMIN01_1810 [Nematocida minor]KAI5192114.1 hypothetical protein NEMIN01_1810 [Nematocida minor]